MFGYEEPDHKVVATTEVTLDGAKVLLERCHGKAPAYAIERLTTADPARGPEIERYIAGYESARHIAVEQPNCSRVVLRYDQPEKLEADWAILVSVSEISREQLQHVERIVGSTGYGRNGQVTMY